MFPQIFWVYFCDISWVDERKGWTGIVRVLVTGTLLWNKESVGILRSPQRPIPGFSVDGLRNDLFGIRETDNEVRGRWRK